MTGEEPWLLRGPAPPRAPAPRRVTRLLTFVVLLAFSTTWVGAGLDTDVARERLDWPSSPWPTGLAPPTPPTVAEGPDPPEVDDPEPVPRARMSFGMDAGSLSDQRAAGVTPDYGTVWIGAWTLRTGWGSPDKQLATMRDAGVTPAIHLYYWGDDITQSCFKHGCWSDLHEAHKDQEGWADLTVQLLQHVQAQMGGRPVMIILETEFNKADIQRYEPFDAALAAKAEVIHEGYPAAQVVLGLGNWNRHLWPTWDRAAAASDAIGIQAVRAARDSGAAYQAVYDDTLRAAAEAAALFEKPIVLHDLALSSLEDDRLVLDQADAVNEFFSRIDELKDVGVEAMIYRSWRDSLTMDVDNTFGSAERAWGIATSRGVLKDAGRAWVVGVLTERAVEDFTAEFHTPKGINSWWVETYVKGSNVVVSVDALVDGKEPVALKKTHWGSWARSFFVAPESEVRFVAKDILGHAVESPSITWPEYPLDGAAGFNLANGANHWWIEVTVEPSVGAVTAMVSGVAVPLSETPWGTWAAPWHVPAGAEVRFIASGEAGPRSSDVFVWA